MVIGINGFEAVIPRFGYEKSGLPKRVGSSEVCFQLLKEFYDIDRKNEYIIYLPSEPTSDMPERRAGWEYKILPNTKLWTVFGLTRELIKRPKLDVFFSPTHYGPLYTPCPEIISILDVSYKYFPELFKKKDLIQLKTWGAYSLKKSRKVITISESSKRDIIKEYKQKPEKVEVVHLGIKETVVSMEKKDFIAKYKLGNPYILFVGTLQPRKNLVRLIEAFAKLKTKNLKDKKDLELIIIGRRGWEYEDILNAPEKYGVGRDVRFLENVSDDELPAFYENAKLFVLPSLYEGFGLPVLEAMKYGCPVVTSNVSSLPEAGGEAAAYFNPEDTDEMAKVISEVLTDETRRRDMVKKGYEQIKKFSWEKSARQVLKVFEEVAQKV